MISPARGTAGNLARVPLQRSGWIGGAFALLPLVAGPSPELGPGLPSGLPSAGAAPETTGIESRASPCFDDRDALLERAMLRFRQRDYEGAAALAAEVGARCPEDREALELLGAARFLLDDRSGALRAWNRMERPLVVQVDVEGTNRTPRAALQGAAGIAPERRLTPELLLRAQRRIEHLPTVRSARVDFDPLEGGRAAIQIQVQETGIRPGSWQQALALGGGALLTGDLGLEAPGPAGSSWAAEGRRRGSVRQTRLAVSGAPNPVPGVWDLSLERSSALFARPVESGEGPSSPEVRPVASHRVRATRLGASQWITGDVLGRIEMSAEDWAGRGSHLGSALALALHPPERSGRVGASLHLDVRGWAATDGGGRFGAVELTAAARWTGARSTTWWTRAGFHGIAPGAPEGVWPLAGSGPPAAVLLRGHPVLGREGIVRTDFHQPRLAHAGVEAVRWGGGIAGARVGFAVFADLARGWGRLPGEAPAAADLGAGLRLGGGPMAGIVRLDAAWAPTRGSGALSLGWMPERGPVQAGRISPPSYPRPPSGE